jgi:Acetyltransferases, including N-acetylases of ribosomal proteins
MKLDLLFTTFPFISGEGVTLNRITEMDFKSLCEIMADEENYRFSPDSAATSPSDVKAKMRAIYANFRDRRSVTLGIFSNDSLNKLIGTLEILNFNQRINSVVVEIMMNRDFTRRGLGTAAMIATVKFLFETIEINRIQAYVMPHNIACKTLLDKSGFFHEGTIREAFIWPDTGIIDLDLYSILYSDYRREQKKKTFTGQHLF